MFVEQIMNFENFTSRIKYFEITFFWNNMISPKEAKVLW
jgi:hypothetical protein